MVKGKEMELWLEISTTCTMNFKRARILKL
jgi:hypothetical protein